MEFNSQICTSIEQSERLLSLGLKRETADMSYQVKFFDPFPQHLVDCTPLLLTHPPINDEERFIPAWSLHRLIDIFKKGINISEYLVCSNAYNEIIDDIEYEIKEGHFNKEYLT